MLNQPEHNYGLLQAVRRPALCRLTKAALKLAITTTHMHKKMTECKIKSSGIS